MNSLSATAWGVTKQGKMRKNRDEKSGKLEKNGNKK
jgi:hypothetical protein